MKKQAKSGQILLVVLLTSIILLTVGLAITSQTITDLNVTTQEQQYTRSFNAAEAGIEDLLGYDSGLAGVAESNDCTIESPCNDVLPGQNDLSYQFGFDETNDGSTGFEAERDNGDALQVDLTDWGTDGNEEYTIYWSATGETPETPAALELIYFYNVGDDDDPDIKIFKRLITDESITCTSGSEAEAPVKSLSQPFPDGKTYQYSYTETDSDSILTSNLKFVRIKPLCAPSTSIAVVPAGKEFPPQFYTAQVESNQAGNVAALEVQQSSQKSLPAIFDYTLFSGGDIQM